MATLVFMHLKYMVNFLLMHSALLIYDNIIICRWEKLESSCLSHVCAAIFQVSAVVRLWADWIRQRSQVQADLHSRLSLPRVSTPGCSLHSMKFVCRWQLWVTAVCSCYYFALFIYLFIFSVHCTQFFI